MDVYKLCLEKLIRVQNLSMLTSHTRKKKKFFLMNSVPENFTFLQHHALFLFSPIQKTGGKANRFVRHVEGSNLQLFLQVFSLLLA